MTAAILRGGDTWPDPDGFNLQLLADDGEASLIPAQDGSCEIVLIERLARNETLVVPIKLPTIRTARAVADEFERVFALVRTVSNGEPFATCLHANVWTGLLAREVRKHRICEDCGTHLGYLEKRDGQWVDESRPETCSVTGAAIGYTFNPR